MVVGDTNLRLAIVGDERLWTDLLRIALGQCGLQVSAAFTDPLVALEQWPKGVDVALLDLDLGPAPMSGFQLAARLRAQAPDMAVVFLTAVADPWMIADAAAAAVAGSSYLLKRRVSSTEHLRQVITIAASGGVTVDEDVLAALRGNGPLPQLNPVQARIVRLMAVGASNGRIAEELGLAVKTVEANITRIARALAVPDKENLRVGCVTRYLIAAVEGAHRSLEARRAT